MNYPFHKQKNIFQRIVLYIAVSVFLSSVVFLPSCSKEEKAVAVSGNLSEVVLEPGDVYAVFDINGYGEITFKLFPDIAPIAVERFTALAEKGYYDSKNIHRIVKDFIIQGGSLYGDGTDGEIQEGEGFKIESSDLARNFFGALCMASDENDINCYQFYIVSNKKSVDIDADIAAVEEILGNTEKELKPEPKARYESYLSDLQKVPENIKELYKTRGGVFRLDGSNTVFGQMIEGEEVIEAIANAEVVSGNQLDDLNSIQSKPLDPVIINSVKIVRIPLPEPTIVTTEETTKKSKKRTTTSASDETSQLTEVIVFGETTTVPESDSPEDEAETVSADTNDSAETETDVENSEAEETLTNTETGVTKENSDVSETNTEAIEESEAESNSKTES